MDIKDIFKQYNRLIDSKLEEILLPIKDYNPDLYNPMYYSLFAGGKRLRPVLSLLMTDILNGVRDFALIAGCCIELIHTYSLIHDDLPCMDDDSLRRGKPTCHIKYGEAIAVLAGDGLLTYAFEILAEKMDNPITAYYLIKLIAHASGPMGMVAGQVSDILSSDMDISSKSNEELLSLLDYIHVNKTAKLIQAAVNVGPTVSDVSDCMEEYVDKFGMLLGRAFQCQDDILDISQSTEQLGKTAGKDIDQNKLTYPSLLGIEKSKEILSQLFIELKKLAGIIDSSNKLTALIDYIEMRKR